jgi:hypothetical protein
MNNDEREFEEWCENDFATSEEVKLFVSMSEPEKVKWYGKKAWFAAIESERKRSKKLIEALEDISNECTWSFAKSVADKALKEYQGGNE